MTSKTSETLCSSARETTLTRLWTRLVRFASSGLTGHGKNGAYLSGKPEKMSGLNGKAKTKPSSSDLINSPSHYKGVQCDCGQPIECIDMIRALTASYGNGIEGYAVGTIWKYLYRAPHKKHKLQDLKKARWFLDDIINLLENQERERQERMIEAFHGANQMVTDPDAVTDAS